MKHFSTFYIGVIKFGFVFFLIVSSCQSLNIEAVLHPDDEHSVARKFALQADRVMQHLEELKARKNANPPEPKLDQLPEEKISGLLEKAGSENVFRQYDVHRRGHITYDDFHTIVNSAASGLSKRESIALAHELDKNRTGVIRYDQIVDTLKNIDAHKVLKGSVSAGGKSNQSSSKQTNIQETRPLQVSSGDQHATVNAADYFVPSVPSYSADEVIHVSSLDPTYKPTIKESEASSSSFEFDDTRHDRVRYHPDYFGSTQAHEVFHANNEPRAKRSHSAPTTGRLRRVPPTEEGAAQVVNFRHNTISRQMIVPINGKPKRQPVSSNPPTTRLDAKSLGSYLASEDDNTPIQRQKPASSDPINQPAISSSVATAYFDPHRLKQRQVERQKAQLEEKEDVAARASKVRANMIISQMRGNLKPLQVMNRNTM